MNKSTHQDENEMLPEYDFKGKKGVRGKYYQAYHQGHSVKIHQEDGTTSTRYFTLEDGAVMLEPDVRKYFPTSDSINNALRSLIEIAPKRPAKREAVSKPSKKRYKG